jgi:hypothetical protein
MLITVQSNGVETMILIPERNVTVEHLKEWYTLKQQLDELKNKEVVLRQFIFNGIFTKPEEGINKFEVADGTGAVLKGTHVINRKVNQEALEALEESLDKSDNLPQLDLDKLVVWKPEVSIKEYRMLTDEQRNLFDQALVIKPGMPSLEIVIPKRT